MTPNTTGPDPQHPTTAEHWQRVHTTRGFDEVSWWQPGEALWLDLIEDLGLPADAPIADIGSGSSLVTEALLARGHTDVLAVDIAAAALDRIRRRVPAGAGATFIEADVRHFESPRPVAVWHDRAVFHFLTDAEDRAAYRDSMRASLAPGGTVVVATFAPDGPPTCSGLPVRRYAPDELATELGFSPRDVVRADHRLHTTPSGTIQPFTIVVATRQ